MPRSKQTARRKKHQTDIAQCQKREANQRQVPKCNFSSNIKLLNPPKPIPTEAFLKRLFPISKFSVDFKDVHSLYKDKLNILGLVSLDKVRDWFPSAELNKIKVRHATKIDPFSQLFKYKFETWNYSRRSMKTLNSESEQEKTVDITAANGEVALEACASLALAELLDEGMLARFLFENFLYKKYNLIKNPWHSSIRLFETPTEIDESSPDDQISKLPEQISVCDFLQMDCSGIATEDTGAYETLGELESPRAVLRAVAGEDVIESANVNKLALEDSETLFEASLKLKGIVTTFKSYASHETYAIEACAALVLKEVFEKPQLAISVLQKFVSKSETNHGELKLYKTAASKVSASFINTNSNLSGQYLQCRESRSSPIETCINNLPPDSKQERRSASCDDFDVSNCKSPKEVFEIVVGNVNLDHFAFWQYEMVHSRRKGFGCSHKSLLNLQKRQFYSDNVYAALQGACATVIAQQYNAFSLAQKSLFIFSSIYKSVNCYRRLKIVKDAKNCLLYAKGGKEFEAELLAEEKVFEERSNNVKDADLEQMLGLFQADRMGWFIGAKNNENDESDEDNPVETKQRKPDKEVDVSKLLTADHLNQKVDSSSCKALLKHPTIQHCSPNLYRNGNKFVVELFIDGKWSYLACSEKSPEEALYVACNLALIASDNSTDIYERLKDDLASMAQFLYDDWGVTLDDLNVIVNGDPSCGCSAKATFQKSVVNSGNCTTKNEAVIEVVRKCVQLAVSSM